MPPVTEDGLQEETCLATRNNGEGAERPCFSGQKGDWCSEGPGFSFGYGGRGADSVGFRKLQGVPCGEDLGFPGAKSGTRQLSQAFIVAAG